MICFLCLKEILPPYVPPFDDQMYFKVIDNYPVEICKQCYNTLKTT